MKKRIVPVAAAATLAGGLWIGLTPLPAGASGGTAKNFTLTLYYGYNPTPNDQSTGTLEPVSTNGSPPDVTETPIGAALYSLPSNCPLDSNAVFMITGNAEGHGTGNNNGFWGGDTIEGDAVLTDPGNDAFAVPYNGSATIWQGSGTNLAQGELGETFHFHGSNGTQPLDVKISYHGTKNNSGNITSFSESVVCS